ncbi:MAG: hypothetical protein WCO66_05250 [Candidatus Absconditabacteria bacterium]
MRIFLHLFKEYLLKSGYTKTIIDRYIRSVSVFLLWYHGDIHTLSDIHLQRFYYFLRIKKYPLEKINEYRTILGIFSHLIQHRSGEENEKFLLRKKLHLDDEVSS